MTQEQAAVKEDKFFEQDPFFGSERVAPFRSRCGVDALRVQLSKQLVALTQRELPKMKQALEEAVVQVGAMLNQWLMCLEPRLVGQSCHTAIMHGIQVAPCTAAS